MARCKDCIHGEVCDIFVHTRTLICNDRADKMCKMFMPTADVVPKSEVEKLVQDGTRLGQENETLKDNNEHLAVILEETKAEVEKLQAEKDALIKNYAECMKDYASEIFAEIETLLALNILVGDVFTGKYFDADLENDIAELKKKYTEGEECPDCKHFVGCEKAVWHGLCEEYDKNTTEEKK